MILLVKLRAISNYSKDYNRNLSDICENVLDKDIFKCLKIVRNDEMRKELAILYVEDYSEDILNTLYSSFDLNRYSVTINQYTNEEFLNTVHFDYIEQFIFNLTEEDLTNIKENISNILRGV